MKIIPSRDMLLSGHPVAQGVAVNVSDADGALALRHHWAVEAPEKQSKAEKAKADAEAKALADAAAAQAQAEAEAAAADALKKQD